MEGNMRVEQISVLLRNQPGVLGDALSKLTEKNINILGLTINENANFGELRIIVDKIKEAKDVLNDLAVSFNIVKIIVSKMNDKPGQLMALTKLLSQNDINIDYIYTLSSGKNSAFVAIKTWNMTETEELLKNNDFELTGIDEIMK
jgi:hypothetical protein